MGTLISDEYREQNRALHKDKPFFGRSGALWLKQIIALAEAKHTTDVLDYGCGKGTLARDLPFPIREYDPAIEGKDAPPEAADIVVCTDVLEHIEPEHLEAVLDHLKELTKLCGFFTIATRPAKKTLPDGRNAHLIIKSPNWWLVHLQRRFRVIRWDVDTHRAGEIVVIVKRRKE